MTILCFGDSNTFGYDSRSHLGDRYPKEVRWTGLLAACTGWAILEAGQNGREIPCRPWELDDLTHRARQADITVIMLGSNDLLQSPDFQAEDVSLRMEVCLSHLLQTRAPASLLLIAPPPMVPGSWVAGDRLPRESARLARCYQALAQRLGTSFADAGTWQVELLSDGVHFSPAGHRAFADGVLPVLQSLAVRLL